MSDEETREMPLADAMGIADAADEPTEPLPVHDMPVRNESARPTGSVGPSNLVDTAGPTDPSGQMRIGTTDGDPVIRPSGPSTGTIVLGVFFCLIGLTATLCLLPIGAWRWMPNPSTLFFYMVGGLGALLLVISVVWAAVAAVRLRRRERQSAEQSPEGQQQQR
ncbi:hypothetical protein G1C98_1429 [Bifidobacterium sp. DSM 109960]|uniref:Uncharacterized protein n=1 Tax=Bifidobacterium erythrocebi TaxID=2675325 RepID=A0A7Y0HVK1_9BIFI|nr:hypothetical protein [Bifidobacterium sp. DSM 109960]NMM96693.1 hypothetical protein [Bifidobacterium sp. DSM 109960]